MNSRIAAALASLSLITAAHAADPTAVIDQTGITFEEYSGTAAVGTGDVNTDGLFFIDENTGPLGKSWYIFFDPKRKTKITGSITFSSDISSVISDKDGLDGSNATYGLSSITYGTSTLIGLEKSDMISWVGNTLYFTFDSVDPGDDIRVFTTIPSAVPEPGTYGLLAAGLLAMGFVARRRKSA